MSLSILALSLVSCRISAQQSAPPPEPQDPDVVRISVRLVQVDGTVSDKRGRSVADLNKDDFQLFVDGQLKPITTFYYVPPITNPSPRPKNESSADEAPIQTSRPRADKVRRIIALVVGNVSADALGDIKKSMNRFVDEQMQSGDLVSIVRPSEGAGVLQQFTSDKRLLHLAINGVRWNPMGTVRVDAVPEPTPEATDADAAAASRRENSFYEDVLSSSWLRSLNLIVRGLQDLPGRKSVILFSNGFQLFGKDEPNRRVMQELQAVTDRASRGLVTFYTVDARGLQPFSMGASVSGDELPGIGTPLKSGTDSHKLPSDGLGAKVVKFVREQDGLVLLAESTGGRFARFNDNIADILGDQQGYYVLGYSPEEDLKPSDQERPFHSIKVKLVRSDLQAHFKKGFYGQPEKSRRQTGTTTQELLAELSSPFDSSNVGVKLTSLFGNDKEQGSFVRSLLHVDVETLTFQDDAEGRKTANLNIFALAFDQRGPVGEVLSQTHAVRIKKEQFSRVQKEGLTYELTTPIQHSGLYQVRVLVQDLETRKIGSASQLVEIPDVASGQLTLTGLIVSAKNPSTSPLPQTLEPVDPRPAVRRFKQGMEISYAVLVLNGLLDPTSHKPKLTSQVVVYRNGEVVYRGAERSLETGKDIDPRRLIVSGTINLGTLLTAGEYVLQVVINDTLATDEKYRRASRWLDFDVIQ